MHDPIVELMAASGVLFTASATAVALRLTGIVSLHWAYVVICVVACLFGAVTCLFVANEIVKAI